MDWKQQHQGDSPDFHWDKCVAATLTETKCEQICTRKRCSFKSPCPFTAAKQVYEALRGRAQKKHMYMYTEREVEGEEKKRNQREYLARRFTTLAKRFQCCPSRSCSSKCFKRKVCQRRKGGRAVGRGRCLKMALWLLLSGLHKSIIKPT